MESTSPAYRLVRQPQPAVVPPRLDAAQRRVVEHEGGPLLVLAGPGTGKTTTIVEAVVDRVARRGIDPSRVLVLTFSRKAAAELRERITLRLDRTLRQPLALTFHSYAYALVRREYALAGEQAPILMAGPEQLLEVRRLLRGEASDGADGWPERLRAAVGTQGFAAELRDFLLRAAERGLDGQGLAALGRRHGRDDWVAAGRFLDSYAARFDLAPVPAYDYAEIIRIAGALLRRGAVRARERDAYDVILVDEYQDTDPAQEELLAQLAGDGRELIAVGDPDQSIYAFRGADVGAIRRFPDLFRTPAGLPADVVALRTCRRSGAALLAASRRVAARLPVAVGHPDMTANREHRTLRPLDGADPGRIQLITAASWSQEAALIADTLRRAHLLDGIAWSQMAVLVRSAVRQAPALQRALTAAGIPVSVAGDELPLTVEPGTRPLLRLLAAAIRAEALDEQAAAELLTGPLGGTDALGLRRLRRGLVAAARAAGQPPAAEPLADALRDPRELAQVGWPGTASAPDDRPALGAADPAVAAARRVAALLEVARAADRTGTPHDVLWAVWEASGLATESQEASKAGGQRGALADADLDAVVALFDAAERFTARLPHGSTRLFLDSLAGQEIVGDTLAQHAPRGEAVAVLTAHRAKGLEWDLVVVAGVQEGTWPDVRRRGSVLGMDELVEVVAGGEPGETGSGSEVAAVAATARLLADERRLFYVAVTRARRELVVTAIGAADSEERPSRFLTELAGDDIEIEHVASTGRRWLSLPALTADLRRAAADASLPAHVRTAAATQLARLAAAGVRGASPRHWYALTELTAAGERLPGSVHISPSRVETFTKCGLRWLLEAAVGVSSPGAAQGLGIVIHAAAALAAEGADDGEVAKRVDELWQHLDFGSSWYTARQRAHAESMVNKFLSWHRSNPRELVAVEERLGVSMGEIRITGQVDRLERDEHGAAIVVDLKTGSSRPADADLDRNPQLGVYQLAVLLGAFEQFGLSEPGGAELVQVGKAGLSATVRVQAQPGLASDPDPGWARELVETVAAGMAGPVFRATANPGCRVCPVASSCPVDERGGQVAL
ncbi:MAG TPA: ATP-dependent DNA helicase [Streptosporangiaceae bacterium]|jgi:superfamily I DNA/RNA helicase/RecB family exonuclease|nr:ATP-dependent DNA helicase [Streptosporangiaceae bacterium]